MNKPNLDFSEVIERTIYQAEKMALGNKQKIHPLHFLFSLIKNPNSESSKILNAYEKTIEQKIKNLR